MEKLVIAPHQLFCILFISRVLSSILYSPVIQPSLEPIEYIFGSIIGILLQLVLLIPLMFYMQLSENQPFCDFSNDLGILSKSLTHFIGILFSAYR